MEKSMLVSVASMARIEIPVVDLVPGVDRCDVQAVLLQDGRAVRGTTEYLAFRMFEQWETAARRAGEGSYGLAAFSTEKAAIYANCLWLEEDCGYRDYARMYEEIARTLDLAGRKKLPDCGHTVGAGMCARVAKYLLVIPTIPEVLCEIHVQPCVDRLSEGQFLLRLDKEQAP